MIKRFFVIMMIFLFLATNANYVKFHATCDFSTDWAKLGCAENATDDFDLYWDEPEPPSPPDEYIQIYFYYPDESSWAKKLNVSYHKIDDEMEWKLRMEIKSHEKVHANISWKLEWQKEYSIEFFTDDEKIDMRKRKNYEHDFSPGIYDFYIKSCIDKIPPSIEIIAPKNKFFNKTVYIKWNATDNIDENPETIIYYNDGISWKEIFHGSENNEYKWKTEKLNGKYIIKVVAIDDAGNIGSNTSKEIIIDNEKPSVEILKPKGWVNGKIKIEWKAFDNIDDDLNITMKYSRDGISWNTLFSNGGDENEYSFDTTSLENGDYIFMLSATDDCGNSGYDFTNLSIYNPLPSQNNIPIIYLNKPKNNSTISGIVKISGSYYDEDGDEVIILIKIDDNEWKEAIVEGDLWHYKLNTKKIENGEHIVYIKAWDGKNYSLIKELHLFIENKTLAPIFFILIFTAIAVMLIFTYIYRIKVK